MNQTSKGNAKEVKLHYARSGKEWKFETIKGEYHLLASG